MHSFHVGSRENCLVSQFTIPCIYTVSMPNTGGGMCSTQIMSCDNSVGTNTQKTLSFSGGGGGGGGVGFSLIPDHTHQNGKESGDILAVSWLC